MNKFMSVIILTKEELKNKLQVALSKNVLCKYNGKPLTIIKVINIIEWAVFGEVHEGVNKFTCSMKARVKVAELEDVKHLKTLSASFTIDANGELSINETLILVDC